jgi:hypothetical protein
MFSSEPRGWGCHDWSFIIIVMSYDALCIHRYIPMFLRNILSPYSARKMGTVCFSETLVSIYKSTWCQNPEHHLHHHENLKSQFFMVYLSSSGRCFDSTFKLTTAASYFSIPCNVVLLVQLTKQGDPELTNHILTELCDPSHCFTLMWPSVPDFWGQYPE